MERKKKVERTKKKKLTKVLMSIAVLVVVVGAVFYFTQVNNIFATKLTLEKPLIDIKVLEAGGQAILVEHVEYLANEIGVYKLHPYNGGPVVIVFEMVDIDKRIALVKDTETYATEEIPEIQDILIRTEQKTVVEIFESESVVEGIRGVAREGEIEIIPVADQETLAMKGYLAIYDLFG